MMKMTIEIPIYNGQRIEDFPLTFKISDTDSKIVVIHSLNFTAHVKKEDLVAAIVKLQ